MLEKGANVNEKGGYFRSSCLMEAVSVNNQELVSLLLDEEGIDVNARNAKNATALHTACYDGNTEMVRKLLAVPGINKNVFDRLGRTPLMAAKAQGYTECVKLMERTTLPESVQQRPTCPEETGEASRGAEEEERGNKVRAKEEIKIKAVLAENEGLDRAERNLVREASL